MEVNGSGQSGGRWRWTEVDGDRWRWIEWAEVHEVYGDGCSWMQADGDGWRWMEVEMERIG